MRLLIRWDQQRRGRLDSDRVGGTEPGNSGVEWCGWGYGWNTLRFDDVVERCFACGRLVETWMSESTWSALGQCSISRIPFLRGITSFQVILSQTREAVHKNKKRILLSNVGRNHSAWAGTSLDEDRSRIRSMLKRRTALVESACILMSYFVAHFSTSHISSGAIQVQSNSSSPQGLQKILWQSRH